MTHGVKILDVSLRDGGHRIGFGFDKETLKFVLTSLDAAGLDCIEIGYRNGYLPGVQSPGIAGMCPREYLLLCRSLLKQSRIAVMVHPQNVTKSDLQELKDCGVQLLRVAVATNKAVEACPVVDWAHDIGLPVSLNLIHISQYTQRSLEETLALLCCRQPEMIYFADSNGSLLPQQVNALFAEFTTKYDLPFGFHAHDNLGLAQANALAAIEGGVTFVDVALAGMGKGTGNLKSEFFIAWLHAVKNTNYKLQPVLEAANYVRNCLNIGQQPLTMDEFVRGISDLSTAQLKQKKEDGSYAAIMPD